MSRVELVEQVESAAYRSWPARELEEYDGWQLRYADGFSRRGNSVYPARASTLAYHEKLEWCGDWYRQRGLDLVVRQTPASEHGLDTVLADLGFALEGRTHVMIADVAAMPTDADADLADEPSKDWWAAMADLWAIGRARSPGWRGIVERIDLPAGYSLIEVDGVAIAAGLAVVDADLLGLFEIIVAPSHRRRGLGRSVTHSLMAWGRTRGATGVYLQVVEENAAAIAMYEYLGFRQAYTYWYRRAPQQRRF